MTKHHHEPRHPYPQEEAIDVRHPYWQRAYRDPRFLAVVFLMLAAITVYVLKNGMVDGPGGPAPAALVIEGK